MINVRKLYPSRVISGMLLYAGLSSLHQDYLGKAGFIEHIEAHWAPASTTIPVACILILYAVVGIFLTEERHTPEKASKDE